MAQFQKTPIKFIFNHYLRAVIDLIYSIFNIYLYANKQLVCITCISTIVGSHTILKISVRTVIKAKIVRHIQGWDIRIPSLYHFFTETSYEGRRVRWWSFNAHVNIRNEMQCLDPPPRVAALKNVFPDVEDDTLSDLVLCAPCVVIHRPRFSKACTCTSVSDAQLC